jgi:hypothetical protein
MDGRRSLSQSLKPRRQSEMVIQGGLHQAEAEVYNGLSGSYDVSLLLRECGGDAEVAAAQIVNGAIAAGMIKDANVTWQDGGVDHETDAYALIEGYLTRQKAAQ